MSRMTYKPCVQERAAYRAQTTTLHAALTHPHAPLNQAARSLTHDRGCTQALKRTLRACVLSRPGGAA